MAPRRMPAAAAAVVATLVALPAATPSHASGLVMADPAPGLVSNMQDARIDQSSGLAYSAGWDDLVYTHNDDPGSPTVFAVQPSTGETVGEFDLENCGIFHDAETIRTDPAAGKVYLADIGDNDKNRADVDICGFDDPGPGGPALVQGTRYPISYPKSVGSEDAEALLINPITGAMYIITKEADGGHLLAFDLPLSTSSNVPTDLGKSMPPEVTDGTFTNDGRWALLAVNGTPDTQVYDTSTMPWTFDGTITTPWVPNGESITMEPGGVSFLVGSEREAPTYPDSPIYRVLIPAKWRNVASDQVKAGTFVPLPPYRLLDTRLGNGAPRAKVPSGGSVSFQVSGRGGVPSSGAGAVVLNVTVTNPTVGGFVTAYPTGATKPNASNLNFNAGQTIPNHVTVKLGDDGRVTLFNGSGGTVDLIADVAGWYGAGDGTDNGTLTTLDAPVRLLDTRAPIGAPKAKIASGAILPFLVAGASGTNVPASGVGAGVLNVTATNTAGSGFLTAYPNGTAQPTASNLNFNAGTTIANAATVKLGDDGKVALYNGSSGSLDAVADIAGWFRSGDPTVAGAFKPLAPARLLDTRAGTGAPTAKIPSGGSVTLEVANHGGVPSSGAGAAVLNVTATNADGSGFITAFPAGTTRPNASNLNIAAGQTIANLVTVKLSTGGKVTFYNGTGGPIDLIADVAGWYKGVDLRPSQVLDLTNWKLTLPTDGSDADTWADEVSPLTNFEVSPWFETVDDYDPSAGVRFEANAGGATTKGSSYPRSELREMANNGQDKAAWSNTSGTHTLTVTQAITHLPVEKPQVVSAQIHDTDDPADPTADIGDIIEIRLEKNKVTQKNRLLVSFNTPDTGQNSRYTLDSDYQLGAKFTLQIRASPTMSSGAPGIRVRYWKTPADPVDVVVPATTVATLPWYFKTGAYTQSNTSNDAPDAYGEVVIYDVTVSHN